MKLKMMALAIVVCTFPAIADDKKLANAECAFNAYMMFEVTKEPQFEKAGDYYNKKAFSWLKRAKMKQRIKEQIAMSRSAIKEQNDAIKYAFHLQPRPAFNNKTCAEQYAIR
ncbi:hypothetical protein P3553_23105 [Vibrio parahaemolyticus]|uniref:hypothetical protein n=1 Tax=Vibrio harveyi group TaxID=717610 RepID=UPI0011DE1A9B|nr:hypothetical protein [Vibrio parahaemolyticus]EGQ8127142.1 hypothetical protein [Vibrio parahaemolyticus]EIN4364738.1 hypothetical protein [Vibrio parahaemolyticus]MDF4796952.1 hypothetical protein [Vibrio parahaemolyticus]MDF5409617.1 hypothetical protein [Vibrio parahaemolyticus]MDG2687280.1 hypothetical protein [Vibrio parahaemolyticus]